MIFHTTTKPHLRLRQMIDTLAMTLSKFRLANSMIRATPQDRPHPEQSMADTRGTGHSHGHLGKPQDPDDGAVFDRIGRQMSNLKSQNPEGGWRRGRELSSSKRWMGFGAIADNSGCRFGNREKKRRRQDRNWAG